MNILSKLLFFISFFILLGCTGEEFPEDPNNQLVKGPFSITTEWQIIELQQPLKTSPHVQSLDILLDMDKYENVEGLPLSQYRALDFGYKRIDDSQIVKPEVILIDQKKKEYRATFDVTGVRYTKLGNYLFLGYGTSGKGKYYFSKETEFIAIKIRANTEMMAEHLNWMAAGFFKWPDRTWEDIHPSKIVDIE